MRIIKEGVLPIRAIDATCQNCKCEFEVDIDVDDIIFEYSQDFGSDVYSFDCPCCSKKCWGSERSRY